MNFNTYNFKLTIKVFSQKFLNKTYNEQKKMTDWSKVRFVRGCKFAKIDKKKSESDSEDEKWRNLVRQHEEERKKEKERIKEERKRREEEQRRKEREEEEERRREEERKRKERERKEREESSKSRKSY